MSTTATESPLYPIASREFETVLTSHEDCPRCERAATDAESSAAVTGSVGATYAYEDREDDGTLTRHLAVVRRLGTAVVFTQPAGCNQCVQTKQSLSKREVPYMNVDVTEYEEALAFVLAQGVKAVPYVVSDIGNWVGLRPDKLMAIGAAHSAASAAYYAH